MEKIICPNPNLNSNFKWVSRGFNQTPQDSHSFMEAVCECVEFGVSEFKNEKGFGESMVMYCKKAYCMGKQYDTVRSSKNYRELIFNTEIGLFMFKKEIVHKAKEIYVEKTGRVWASNFVAEMLMPEKNYSLVY